MLLRCKLVCYELELFVKLTFWALILKILRLYIWVFLIHFHMNVSCKKLPHELRFNCYTFKHNITTNR